MTPQRLAICEYLTNSRDHPTTQQIYESLRTIFPSLSLATVYHTLDLLVKHGCVNSLGHAGDGQVHYDAQTEPHVNIACISCHSIIDYESESAVRLAGEIHAQSGFKLMGSSLLYYGICSACQIR